MDYESFKFTEDEKKNLIINRDKIISWIMSDIIPYILPDDLISIDFGKDYYSPRSEEYVKSYHLDVCGGKSIESSHNGQHVLMAEKFGNFIPLSEVDDYTTIYALIDNWKSIKNQLLASIRTRSEVHNKIENFEV